MIRAVLFDLDGTLIKQADSRACARAMAQIYGEFGFHITHEQLYEDWISRPNDASRIGLPWRDLEALLGGPLDESTRARLVPLMVEVGAGGQPLEAMPGARECVESARRLGLRVGVVTGGSGAWARAALPKVGPMALFDSITSADDTEMSKPAPDPYLRALDVMGVSSFEAVAVEDSTVGLASAVAAGLRCIVVPSPHFQVEGEDFSAAFMQVTSLEHLAWEEVLDVLQ